MCIFFSMKKIFSEKWKIEKWKKSPFFDHFFFSRKFWKKWLFRFFRFSIVYENIFFIEKIIISEKKYFLFFIISHAQTPQVASRNSLCAAHGRGKRIPENPKNHVFGDFLMIFQSKMTQMTCLSGHIWLWDPVLRRVELQMDLARSSSGVMRTSPACE